MEEIIKIVWALYVIYISARMTKVGKKLKIKNIFSFVIFMTGITMLLPLGTTAITLFFYNICKKNIMKNIAFAFCFTICSWQTKELIDELESEEGI